MNDHFLILKNHRQAISKTQGQRNEQARPQIPQAKRVVKPRRLAVKPAGEGKWSKKEQTAYINFLIRNFDTMLKGKLRKSKKIFIRMSKTVRTRVPQQCRSHHQKMMELHQSLQEIIRFFQQEVLPLHQEDLKCNKHVKTADRQGNVQFDGLYRIKINGNCIKIEINQDLIATY